MAVNDSQKAIEAINRLARATEGVVRTLEEANRIAKAQYKFDAYGTKDEEI